MSKSTRRLVSQWTSDLSAELADIVAEREGENDEVRRETVEEAEDALRFSITVLESVSDVISADTALRKLRGNIEGLQRAIRVEIFDHVIQLIEENIFAPVTPDPVGDVRSNAIRFLRAHISADQQAKIREEMSQNSGQFSIETHFPFGMAVRNALRSAGYTEDVLGVASLDHVWADLLQEAIVKPTDDDAMEDSTTVVPNGTVWIAAPKSVPAEMVRRWGLLANTGISDSQFVVFKSAEGIHLVLQNRNGEEVIMTEGARSGVFDSVGAAYEAVVRWVSALLEGSRILKGPCNEITIVDTTDEDVCFEMGNLWTSGGNILERCCFDPDTLKSLGNSTS